MSLNSNAVQPTITPQQQDIGLPAALPPGTPDVANPSEPEQSGPVLLNRAATNSSTEMVGELNQSSISIDNNSAPEKSDRSSSASSGAASATTDDELTTLITAACSGDAESQYQLGERYFGIGGIEVNKEIAFMGYDRACRAGACFPEISFIPIEFCDLFQTECVWLDEDRALIFSESHNQTRQVSSFYSFSVDGHFFARSWSYSLRNL